jgi:hypothetical protein
MKKSNNLAVFGFLLPFAASAIAGSLILVVKKNFASMKFLIPYLSLLPFLLLCGLVCSIKSIPLIPDLNDKDYAYSGLTVNVLFIMIYIVSVVYFFRS